MPDNGSRRLLVIGNGMVGQRLLETLVAKRNGWRITVLGEELRAAYDRVQLSAFFSGTSAAELSLVDDDFFTRNDIECLLGERAIAIDRNARCVCTASGREFGYDALVLATGSRPFVPAIPGHDRADCFVYRTIEDLEAIKAAGERSRTGVVVGGGLLGLEAARALRDLGLATHVVEFAPRLMAVQLDDPGARLLRARIEALGVTVHSGRSTLEIVPGESARYRMLFAGGDSLETDLVVFSAGIRARDELARDAGLAIGERGGIAIDDQCRTSDPAIFAIGECALWSGRVYGLVAPGYRMAEVAAAAMCGDEGARFAGADMSTRLKLLGVDVASLGDAHAVSPGARSYCFSDERRALYRRLVVNEDGTRLLGGMLVGDAADYGSWLQLLQNELPLPAPPEQMLLGAPAGGETMPSLGIAGLPDAAQICSCNNVSKGALCEAVANGSTTLGALKKCTRAASSCGGCAPLVRQILEAELARAGVAVNRSLCEHFPHTRQELLHLVRAKEIRTFEQLIAQHGRGRGCDVCKPAIASILASTWNDFVLSPGHAPLQDTNDYFLANMQKDGTYSVVPRIPGGEITPRKLIAIGEIALRYRLYTKITGGQRIDLFGAQLNQLPQIWRELIDAGFESGHAYGKAVRTVKSCVGSTWCRYGVQDSVGLAIAIESRYRGLRAPHKIKLAVSGCTRECAEAQSKDVGVIATERGWNLYVCGNGGMKPRHADLLARDLDTDTLIRFIDRFLMFYIRTADRLQRTATWLDNLEGGLEYLRGVVCEDTLGIGTELESAMAALVASYACEWKAAIEDPAVLARFRHFVNSDSTDDNVVFVQERGQIRPVSAAERGHATLGETA